MSLDEFLKDYTEVKTKCQIVNRSKTRGEVVVPKLSYVIAGRSTIIKNYQALCKHTNRSVKFLVKYFASKLGASYELTNNQFKVKLEVKTSKLKEIENLYYKEEVLCTKCKSPDTIREDLSNKVVCSSCTHEEYR